MKKQLVITGLLLLFALLPAAAQHTDSMRYYRRADGRRLNVETVSRDSVGIDTLRRIDAMDSGLVTLREGGNDGSVVLEVAGFGLTLGRAPETDSDADLVIKYGRVKLYFFNSGEFGFTKLSSASITAVMLPKRKDFWSRNWGIRSIAPPR